MRQTPYVATIHFEARKLEGSVVLKAVISSTGPVSDLRLVEGEAALADAATKAVKEWRYKPYARDGIPVPFQTVIILDFQQP